MLRIAVILIQLAVAGAQCTGVSVLTVGVVSEFPSCLGNCSNLCQPLDTVVTAYAMNPDAENAARLVCNDKEEWLCAIVTAPDACLPLVAGAEDLITGLAIPRTSDTLDAYCEALATTTTTTTTVMADSGSLNLSSTLALGFAWGFGVLLNLLS
mmetsp:Transcript_100715/g.139942  ORF Transcript_100715/g.139942 Transcript_100715/m.139942 type:complete len:154 (+) Transcript_100715:65-526(+)